MSALQHSLPSAVVPDLPASVGVLRRTFSPDLLNRVVNDPTVRPWIGGGSELVDMSAVAANRANVLLVNEAGGFWCQPRGWGRYEVHTQFLKQGRGENARRAAQELLRYMFLRTDCTELLTQVERPNRAALNLALGAGFTLRFSREADGKVTDYLGLRLDDWIMTAPDCEAEGVLFHAWLDAAKARRGVGLPSHSDDETHDRFAGAGWLMVKAGNPIKAADTYNRWAVFAGYQPCEIVSLSPLIIDIGDGLIGVSGSDLELL